MDVGMATTNAAQAAAAAYGTKETNKTEDGKKVYSGGKTIGQPKLSEKAQKYYEELKAKYNKLDFILVSSDMKETAKANAGSYANPNKMVVLVDEEKIERMAQDEKFRKQYEGLIASAQSNMPKLAQTLGNHSNVKGYGMQVNDNGTASFFAVMKKSSDEQTARIARKREEKRAEKKAEEKKADKKAKEEKLKEKRTEKSEKAEGEEEIRDLFGEYKNEDVEILSASSIEELLRKVEDYNFALRSDNVRTEAEKAVGVNFDFRL